MLDGSDWVPTFPNAPYIMTQQEWAHWESEGQSQFAVTLDDAVRPLLVAGLVDLVGPDHRVTDEVWLQPTPGHTPGHTSVRIASGGEKAIITGDAVHSPVQWAEPDWASVADVDSGVSTDTRHRLLQELADEPTLVIGTHFPPPGAGYVVKEGTTFRFMSLH
jgi:glyoxylase-like metal-dependent hydrolase (beta-lactamase superfamily II)